MCAASFNRRDTPPAPPFSTALNTNFMRADLEALTEFHRSGHAPVWRDFFARWNEEVNSNRKKVIPFTPKPVPAFKPMQFERQEVLQKQD